MPFTDMALANMILSFLNAGTWWIVWLMKGLKSTKTSSGFALFFLAIAILQAAVYFSK